MSIAGEGEVVDTGTYRHVMGRLAKGVVVLTTTSSGQDHALTANSLTSVSLDPVLLLVCVETDARFHDAAAAEGAEQDFVNRSQGGVPDEIPELALSGAPLGIAQLLKQAGLAPSTSEANRLIDGGGVRVDSSAVSDKGLKLEAGTYVVQVGKRKFARVTVG